MIPHSFKIEFQFEGRLADEGALDGSDHEAATQAARRLLAVHAHCFLTGKVPTSARSETGQYQVQHVESRKGSHVDVWTVVIFPSAVAIASVVGNAYASEIKCGVNACASFLRDSLRSALGTGPDHLPVFPRQEPVLEARDGNREPIVDLDIEHGGERLRLREVTVRVLLNEARPVGRSADRLTILIEGEPVGQIDAQVKRRLQAISLADQIGDAAALLRKQRNVASSLLGSSRMLQ